MSSGLSATIGPQNKVEDLSGLYLVPGENPYAAFINACADRHVSRIPSTNAESCG